MSAPARPSRTERTSRHRACSSAVTVRQAHLRAAPVPPRPRSPLGAAAAERHLAEESVGARVGLALEDLEPREALHRREVLGLYLERRAAHRRRLVDAHRDATRQATPSAPGNQKIHPWRPVATLQVLPSSAPAASIQVPPSRHREVRWFESWSSIDSQCKSAPPEGGALCLVTCSLAARRSLASSVSTRSVRARTPRRQDDAEVRAVDLPISVQVCSARRAGAGSPRGQQDSKIR